MRWTPQRIRRLRQVLGISQEELARRIGTGYHRMRQLEAMPTAEQCRKLDKLAEGQGI